jgi:murein L,D-transpeptidase YafK
MAHRSSISYFFRYRLRKLANDYQTYCFDREIKKAYRISFGAPSVVTEYPALSILLPLGIALIALSLIFAPKIKEAAARPIVPMKILALKLRSTIVSALPSRKKSAKEQVVTLPQPIQPKPMAKDYLYALFADKTKKTLGLYKVFQNGKFRLEKEYNIMIGAQWGRKERQGDLKTPEGFYWIINRMEKYELPPLYGVRAFILNYPNTQDVAEGRSGTGIWIHGYQDDKKENTKGCLALDNNDLEDITEYIGIGTPLLITEAAPAPEDSLKKYFSLKSLLTVRDSLITQSRKTETFATTFMERWRVAWESKDIESYASLYSPDFIQNGMAFPEWKEYKKAIFNRSADISVNVMDVKLVQLKKDTAIIRFTQEYLSGDYRAVNGKMLKIVQLDGHWKIEEELRM